MATSYLTKSSTKKAAPEKGSTKAAANDAGEKEVKGSAKRTAAPKKTAAKRGGTPAPAAPSGGAKKAAPAIGSAKKTAAASGAAKKTPAAAKTSAKKTPSAGSGAAKKTARRDVPKESPMKGVSIEQWVKDKASGWQAQAIAKIVALVKKAAPDATASIKWGQPVFESNGPFAYIRPAKAHVTFGFWRGGEVADPKGLLEGAGDRMQHMKLAGLDQIDERAIAAMVKDAVRLNREKGTPTMRGRG